MNSRPLRIRVAPWSDPALDLRMLRTIDDLQLPAVHPTTRLEANAAITAASNLKGSVIAPGAKLRLLSNIELISEDLLLFLSKLHASARVGHLGHVHGFHRNWCTLIRQLILLLVVQPLQPRAHDTTARALGRLWGRLGAR